MPRTDRQLTSRLHTVVVHSTGALCRRRASFTLPAGAEGRLRIRLDGLPLTADPHSLRGSLLSGPDRLRVLDVRRVVEAELTEAEDLSPLRRACDAAEEALYAAGAARAGLAAQVEHVAALRAVPPVPRRGEPPRRAPAEALLALAEFVDTRLGALRQRLLAAEDALREAEQAAETARRRLRAASAGQSGQPADQVGRSSSVLLTLDQGGAAAEGGAEVELELEYGVPGATWTPTYHLRLDGLDGGELRAGLVMRAQVAQRTGEDWSGVRLGLSTADLRRRSDLPELRSLRIGRRQEAAVPQVWREPPGGLAELFRGYDDFLRPVREAAAPGFAPVAGGGSPAAASGGPVPFPMAAPPPAPMGRSRARSVLAEGSYGAAADVARSAAVPQAPGGAAPVRAMAKRAAGPGAAAEPVGGGGGGGGGVAGRDYAQLVLAGADAAPGARGLLAPVGQVAAFAAEQAAAEAVARQPLPPHCVPVRVSAGSFDHRYDAGAPVDLPSDGGWHTVPVLEFPVESAVEHVCVPAVDPRVYAAVRLGNGSGHALLAGAAEVSVDGAYLMTVQLPTLAPGEQRRVGIGVVEGVQVARRVRSKESNAGLRGGTTVIEQGIEVELANRLGRPVTVEVRERVPVSDDKDVRIEERPASPPWTAVPPEQDERHQRGMRVWRATLAPHARQRLTGGYEIRVPVAKALLDGNRRL
ncbi:DUF4139 domain-containing protein [Streptacidiphilus cavernicola]|uniref:DUF4139 domain-containing protein n=1 Tax=Streptacidiphilus cavernicola TaxID=3342716 RepID=A0ABV6VU26_9ACTN